MVSLHISGGVHSSLDWPEDDWDKLHKTNLTGSWLVAKHVCRHMRDAKIKGSVINISSVAGLHRGDVHGSTGYASSKAAMHAVTKVPPLFLGKRSFQQWVRDKLCTLMQVMALELGALGIRVNSIAPGIFQLEITAALLQKSWWNTVTSKIVPLKTYGTTDPALTSLVRFLIHETSSYVTGNVFIIDAGLTLPGVPIFSSL